MKKSLLIGSALLVGFGMSAQNAKQVLKNNQPKLMVGEKAISNDGPALSTKNYQPTAKNTNSVLVSPPYQRFTASINMFSYLLAEQNCLTYNADINAIAFVHRKSPDWTGVPPNGAGASGYISTKWSTNNGGTWDSTNYYQNDVNRGRYPTSVIYNPAGNTTPANAVIAAFGPTTNGSGWTGQLLASTNLTTGVKSSNDQQWYDASLSNPAKSLSLGRYHGGIAMPGGTQTVVFGGVKYATPTGSSPAGSYGVALLKGTYSGSAFTWVQDSSWNYKFAKAGANYAFTAPKTAFDATGMTGYLLVNGIDSAAAMGTNMRKHYQPLVWKTTDGGATWTRVNANYDWIASHPEVLLNLRPTVAGNATVPAFFDTYGGDITVDNTGKLHYVTAVVPGYSTHVDSVGYGYQYPFGFQQYVCDDRPWIWDFTTDGNGTWNATAIGELYSNACGDDPATDTTANVNPWIDATTPKLAYDNRIQISRSANGAKVFYTWADGDTTNVAGSPLQYQPISNPSLTYRGYDVATNTFTPIMQKDYTTTNAGFYFHFTSDITMNPAPGTWTIPNTYCDSRNGSYDDGLTIDVYYVDDVTFTTPDFATTLPSNTAPMNCMVGVNQVEKGNIGGVSQNYPNPFNSVSTINVKLNKAETIELSVLNSVGQVVMSKTISGLAGANTIEVDAANLNSGLYFYTVKAGNASVTKKMTVQK